MILNVLACVNIWFGSCDLILNVLACGMISRTMWFECSLISCSVKIVLDVCVSLTMRSIC
ncbi:hypothetical protein Hanom_Chr07g00598841 [Helianthus anomalus]